MGELAATEREVVVEVDDGSLVGIDFGGDGPPVVFVHSIGYSCPQWRPLAEAVAGDCHGYAFDLRGHGQTTAPLANSLQPADDLLHILDSLGLHRPLIVGHELGSFYGLLLASRDPDRIAGIVSVGAWIAGPKERAMTYLEMGTSPVFLEPIRERFLLGEIGFTEEWKSQFVGVMVQRSETDWLSADLGTFREEVERSIQPLPDGGFIHLPTIETVATGHRFDEDGPLPCDHGWDELPVPFWALAVKDYDDEIRADLDRVAGERANLHAADIEGGQFPHSRVPEQVAQIVRPIIQTCSPS